MASYPTLIRGTAAWLYSAIKAQLPTINAELTANVVGAKTAPQFALVMGDPPVVNTPTIALGFGSLTRTRFAQHNYRFDLNFRITVLIPHAADDTAQNYEMCREIAADNLLSLFSDEVLTLTPSINAGPLGTAHALSTDFSTLMDIFPRKQADGITVVRGFEMPLTISFTLTSHS